MDEEQNTNIKKIQKNVEQRLSIKKIQEIAETLSPEKDEINIVNAGLMNVGKSSLFNALADQEDLFKVMDIPTTIVCQTIKMNGINLIDTPGIGARDADTEEAFRAYRQSDMILFVHNVNTGELHRDEIVAINDISKEFPQKQDFWERFCLVVSRDDLRNDEEIPKIIDKIKIDVKNHCGGERFPLYITSALRYWKGVHQNQPIFLEKSGINELKTFLLEKSIKLIANSLELRQERLNEIKRKELIEWGKQKSFHEEKIVRRQHEHAVKRKRAEDELQRIHNATQSMWTNCQSLAEELRKW